MAILFKAKTNEGYVIKILAELLHNNIRLVCLKIQDTGIYIRMMDSNRLVLIDIELLRPQFHVYELSVSELNVGVNVGHLFKMLKSIRKKDAVMFSIDGEDPDNLILTVFPKEGKRTVSSVIRTQPIQHISIPLPTGYEYPVNIGSSDFQQTIKDISSISESILFRMNRFSMFISSNAQDSIYTKKVHFGEEEEEGSSSEQYTDSFHTEQFLRIIKIAALTDKLQVFAGSEDKPLLIRSNVGCLGAISVFIKSQRQIQDDEKS